MANDKVISASALIAKFEEAYENKWGYIYGMTHEMWNATKQENYNKAKKDDPDCQNSIKYGSKWYGHWVTDCSGLFAWAFAALGSYMYHGSNTMYRSYCVAKGQLSNGKRTDGKELLPGTAVFTGTESNHGHVGLYIGNGWVIEAAGTQDGVIRTAVTNKKWTFWGELKNVDYGSSPSHAPEPVKHGYAEVTGKKVALRTAPTTQASVIMRIDTGKTVKIESPPPSEWDYVSYQGKSGYMMKKFLREG